MSGTSNTDASESYIHKSLKAAMLTAEIQDS